MIEHVVLFKFKESVTEETRATIRRELLAMKGKIPGIVDLTAGDNFSERSGGFEMGLVVRLYDREALDAYHDHPEHQKVLQNHLKPNLADLVAVDYEIGE